MESESILVYGVSLQDSLGYTEKLCLESQSPQKKKYWEDNLGHQSLPSTWFRDRSLIIPSCVCQASWFLYPQLIFP